LSDYPEEFKKDREASYKLGKSLFLLGHLSVGTCLTLFAILYLSGNSSAGISGVPLGLSFLFYIAAKSHLESSYADWLFEKQPENQKQHKAKSSPLKRMAILFLFLTSFLIFAFCVLPWLLGRG
jgi:hypothetical protein